MIYAVLDFETTGLSPQKNAIVEIGIMKMQSNGEIIAQFETLINPLTRVGAEWIHGISEEMVQQAPVFSEIADELLSFLDGAIPVAHNSKFDIPFLMEALKKVKLPYNTIQSLCTLTLSRRYIKNCNSYNLENLCRKIGIVNDQAHSALADAKATSLLLKFLLNNYQIENEDFPNKKFIDLYKNAPLGLGSNLYTRKDYFSDQL